MPVIKALILHKDKAMEVSQWDSIERARQDGEPHWLDICAPTDEDLERLRRIYAFHPLAIQDCRDLSQRAKVKEYDGFCFVVTPMIRADSPRVAAVELDVFLGSSFLVTVHREPSTVIDRLWTAERKNCDSLRRGTDFLLYQNLDALVDDYFPALDRLDSRIAFAEREIFGRSGQRIIDSLLRLKREVLFLRRILGPLREAVSALVRRDFPYIRPEFRLYFQDLYDHMIRLFEMVDTQRDLISGAMEAHLSNVSNRLSEVMKVLTVITTIMMPLTVVTGFYGMNFKNMPELNWRFGPLWALGLMALVTGAMLAYVRRRGWL